MKSYTPYISNIPYIQKHDARKIREGNKGIWVIGEIREILIRFLIYQKLDKIYQMKSYTPYISNIPYIQKHDARKIREGNKGIWVIGEIREILIRFLIYQKLDKIYQMKSYTPYIPIPPIPLYPELLRERERLYHLDIILGTALIFRDNFSLYSC